LSFIKLFLLRQFKNNLIALLFLALGVCSNLSWSADSIVYNETLDGFKYPFAVDYYKFESFGQDLKMAYMHVRSPMTETSSSKPTAVLLHGKNFSGFYWEDVVHSLQDWGYDVLIPDQIGFGKSSKPVNFQYSFRQFARLTHELLKSKGIDNFIVIGHSMGGMLAIEMAYLFPKEVQNLVLVNPIGLEDYGYYSAPKPYEFFLNYERKKNIEDIIAYQKKNYYAGQWEEKYEALTRIHEGWLNGPDAEKIQTVNALTYNMIFSEPAILKVPELQTNISLILGTRDRTGPGRGWRSNELDYELGRYDKLGNHIKQKNKKVRLFELNELGHLPQIEDYSRFESVLKKSLQ